MGTVLNKYSMTALSRHMIYGSFLSLSLSLSLNHCKKKKSVQFTVKKAAPSEIPRKNSDNLSRITGWQKPSWKEKFYLKTLVSNSISGGARLCTV